MRVLLGVHQFFPFHYTGTERYVLNLAKQLQKMGHYVKVLTYTFKEQDGFKKSIHSKLLYKEYTFEGVPVLAIRHQIQPDDLLFVFDFMDEEIYKETEQIFKNEGFDIYHCAHPLRIASSIKAAKDNGLRVIFMVTDFFMMCPMGIMLRADNTLCNGPDNGINCLKYCFTNVDKERMQRRISDANILINCCDVLLSPSQFLIATFDYAGFILSSRFLLSRHGFDYSNKKSLFNKKTGNTITFGYIGTVQYHKGTHIMIEGFRKVKNPNIKLQVWGGSFHELDYRRKVEKLAREDNRIEFKGQYDFNDIEEILEQIDVVIVPSIWYENAPLTISSALAYGIPVIASDIGGMREAIMNGKNGLIFKVADPDDLANKIQSLANEPKLIENIAKTIEYPIRIEEEAFNTELIYKSLLSSNDNKP